MHASEVSRSILIIDDDEIALAFMRGFLTEEGYRVVTTADGPRAIELYRDKKPDLVLLDLSLPTMGGLEVLRQLKSLDPCVRVILVTGHATPEARVVAIGYGALAILKKPVDSEDLLHAIRGQLEPS